MFLLSQCTRGLFLNYGHEPHVVVASENRVRQFVHLYLEPLSALQYLLPHSLDRCSMVRHLPKADAVGAFELERLSDGLLLVLVV